METLMLAKAGYDVGKGVFNWLDAKNRKFKMTPEERKARQSARTDATFGMGAQSFNQGANQIRQTTADANQQLRARSFAGGLENSAVTRATQGQTTQMEQGQIANLALQIADRNAQFRQQSGQRLENINMQIGARRRQFNEARDAQMKQAAIETGGAILNFAIQTQATSDANSLAKDVATENAVAGQYVSQIGELFSEGKVDAANKLFLEFQNEEFDAIDISSFVKHIEKSFIKESD